MRTAFQEDSHKTFGGGLAILVALCCLGGVAFLIAARGPAIAWPLAAGAFALGFA